MSTCDSTSGPGVRTPPTRNASTSAYLLNRQRPFDVTSPSQPITARITGSSNATPVPIIIAIMKPTTSSIMTAGSILKCSVPAGKTSANDSMYDSAGLQRTP